MRDLSQQPWRTLTAGVIEPATTASHAKATSWGPAAHCTLRGGQGVWAGA
jgi:hypothetical protein